MILIFGLSLIELAGIITGILFILTFLGCRCLFNSRIVRLKIIQKIIKYHNLFIYLALIFFIIHAFLAMSVRFGIMI